MITNLTIRKNSILTDFNISAQLDSQNAQYLTSGPLHSLPYVNYLHSKSKMCNITLTSASLPVGTNKGTMTTY